MIGNGLNKINLQMHQTINFLNVLDSKGRKSFVNTPKSQSVKEKIYSKRNPRFPFAKAIDFNEDQYSPFPKWLTQKDGFIDFMYKNYEQKLLSIPQICEKQQRASDQKYFVSLYLEQIPFFQNLPPVVKDIILSSLKTRNFRPGECIHPQGSPQFIAVIFVGAVQWKSDKKIIVKEKNEVILTDAFQGKFHESIFCREQAILLTLHKSAYGVIVTKLREEIETKQRDQISDLKKSIFFSQLHFKEAKAESFYKNCQLKFYFKGQVVQQAGGQVGNFYLVFRGQLQEENHIYIRQHNKWPLPHRKWEVRAVYNSYHKSNKMRRFDFFGDQEIISGSKFRSKYVSVSWVILFTLSAAKFDSLLSSEQIKRLKKYRSEHIDINYGEFQRKIRQKVKSVSEKKRIVAKAISTSFTNKTPSSPKRLSLITNFQKSMLNKPFFNNLVDF